MVDDSYPVRELAAHWSGILGVNPRIGDEDSFRGLVGIESEYGPEFYMKRLEPWRNLPLADEHRVLTHLVRCGISVPVHEVTDTGAISAQWAGQSFILMARFGNHSLLSDEIPGMECQVGTQTAGLHWALRTYVAPVRSYTEDISGTLEKILHLPQPLLGRFRERRSEIVRRVNALPLQTVHGDFTPENVLRRGDGSVSAFIDFDHLPLAPRIWDVAKYLSRRLRSRWCTGAEIDRSQVAPGLDPLTCVREFVAGYDREAPLSDSEFAALPGAILAYNVMEASYDQSVLDGILERRVLPDHREILEDTLAAISWQLDHEDLVTEAVEAGR